MIRAILEDLKRDVPAGMIAARFHNTLIGWAGDLVSRFDGEDVVLSGGCWVNRRLAEATMSRIEAKGRRAWLAGAIPPNDGGLAAGQLAVSLATARDVAS
jgi:hydrogenase maturation protein HypF